MGKDVHSVYNQSIALLWDDAFFRTLNEARRLAAGRASDADGLNSDLLKLLDKGFVATQILGIRRLSDPGDVEGDRAVISLPAILDDIEREPDLFTREHYVCHDGIRFEPIADPQEWGMGRSSLAEVARKLRQLSSVNESDRTRDDRLDPRIFRALRSKLGRCDDFRSYANKFLAHAAAPTDSRTRIREKKITLDKMDDSYKALVEVASFLGGVIPYESPIGGVAVPQYDHLENLDKPLILSEQKKELNEHWRERDRLVGEWQSSLWDGIRLNTPLR